MIVFRHHSGTTFGTRSSSKNPSPYLFARQQAKVATFIASLPSLPPFFLLRSIKMAANRQLIFLALLLSVLLVGIYAQGVCVHQGKQYRNGDEWTYRSFVMRCDVFHNYWQTKVVACNSLMGDRIPVGGQVRDRHGLWKCIQDPSGSTRLVQE